jgi:hypothetical protein
VGHRERGNEKRRKREMGPIVKDFEFYCKNNGKHPNIQAGQRHE